MTIGAFFSLLAAAIGTLSAVYFAIGTLRLNDRAIFEISSMYWDYNKNLASSIASQRAEYMVGAGLLLMTFVIQLAGALLPGTSQTIFENLPCALVAAVIIVIVVSALAVVFCRALTQTMQSRIDARAAAVLGEQKNEAL